MISSRQHENLFSGSTENRLESEQGCTVGGPVAQNHDLNAKAKHYSVDCITETKSQLLKGKVPTSFSVLIFGFNNRYQHTVIFTTHVLLLGVK